jgi:hypothetical protein
MVLSRILFAIEYSLTFSRVLDLMAEGRFEEASKISAKASKFDRLLEWRILKVNLHKEMKQYEAALEEARATIALLVGSRAHRECDKQYLLAYLKCVADGSDYYFHGSQSETRPREFIVEWNLIQLSDISPEYRRNFPLRQHPAWPKGL